MTRHTLKRDLVLVGFSLLFWSSVACGIQTSDADVGIRAAISQIVTAAGYEVTDKNSTVNREVTDLEQRDANAYRPSSRTFVRLRSVREWSREAGTYFRYWLARETYESEDQAEKRVQEYLTDFHERLATPEYTSHMVSKTIVRVGARRRNKTVYLLVTDAAYTLYDDRQQRDVMLSRLVSSGP